MKKSMKISLKRFLFVVIIIMVLSLLVSCTGRPAAGENPSDVLANARLAKSGTGGVEINFIPNNPPTQLFDQDELVALIEVNNRGNYDLGPQDCFIQITGFDPNILLGNFDVARSCAENVGTLEGKDIYNTKGGQNIIEFRSPNILLPFGMFEYNPPLNFLACYNYQTSASPQVCVDPLRYNIAHEQVACNFRKSVNVGSGQGGPVGVSYVGTEMIGAKAIFDITITNFGSGTVLSPYTDLRSCASSPEYTDVNKVAYDVRLTGGSLIDCSPRDGFVRLVGNTGKIICKFNINSATAFETPLLIDLNYNYVKSFKKQLTIIKTPE